METVSLAIGMGLVVSLLFSELFGLAAGGMVVPGYIALRLGSPVDVALTLAAAFATYLIVHALSTITIVYGKRRTVLMVLVGYLVGIFISRISFGALEVQPLLGGAEFAVIGHIIPGLIAIWIDRQGLLETVSTLLTASAVVRLALILALGSELML